MGRISDTGSVADDVISAIAVVKELVTSKRGQCGTQAAIRTIARDSKVPASVVRRLYHPSRYPKDIGLRVWRGLRDAYLRYLRQQIRDIETKIRCIEAADHLDAGTREALVDEAQALIARVRSAL